jgi:hypothetical protein
MARNMPEVDLTNSEQNAFVQDWLTAWAKQWPGVPFNDIEGAIESIQETYNYQDHERRTNSCLTHP